MKAHAPARANILLVDDTPANLLSLEAILEPLGQPLVMARSGQEALKAVLDMDFAVILLDVQMAGMDGLQTAELIKRRKASRHIPIIFLTAINRDEAHIFKGYAHGAVDYLLKPFDPDILRSKVSVFVDLYLMSEQVKRQAERLLERERELAERERHYEAERRARAEAEAVSRAREEVLAAVSHDLRSPLAAIQMGSALLQQGLAEGEDLARLRRHVERIQHSSERMRRLVEDLLELSRMEAGHLRIEMRPTEVRTLLTQALEVFQPLAAKQGLSLREDVEDAAALVACDPERIFQVLSNLLSNSLKFTPAGGSVTVRSRRVDGRVQLSVSDTGAGIPQDQLPHIFERYWQAKRSDRRGIGLGLAIAKGILEAHGGQLWVESRQGEGSTFTFTLDPAPAQGQGGRAEDTVAS